MVWFYCRLKEEAAEQKKADDKARREEIFQAYQRKKAAEAEAEQAAKGPAPVVRRQKPKLKPKRPMSQPPVMDDKHSQSSGSQEDLFSKSKYWLSACHSI